jgi:hypothetical protein
MLEWIDGEHYIIVKGFRYYLTGWEGAGAEFVDVPDRFTTNFASTPRFVWPIFPPTGKYAQIAVVHDKLFLAPVIRSALSARPSTREEANSIFLDGSEVLGVSWFARKVMYRMLQAFSGPEWERYRAMDRMIELSPTPVQLKQFEAATVAERVAK